MRHGTSMKWVVVLAMLACATVGMAAEASVSLDVSSAYVFRGATFNDGLDLSLAPSGLGRGSPRSPGQGF